MRLLFDFWIVRFYASELALLSAKHPHCMYLPKNKRIP